MARISSKASTEPAATPKDAADGGEYDGQTEGIHLGRPRTTIVDEYPERPYSEAVTVPQMELLKSAGQEPV